MVSWTSKQPTPMSSRPSQSLLTNYKSHRRISHTLHTTGQLQQVYTCIYMCIHVYTCVYMCMYMYAMVHNIHQRIVGLVKVYSPRKTATDEYHNIHIGSEVHVHVCYGSLSLWTCYQMVAYHQSLDHPLPLLLQ